VGTEASEDFAGHLYLWPGRGLYIGHAADTELHAHHALQICFGIDGEVEIDRADDRVIEVVRGRWIVIEPDRPHRLRAAAGRVALLYLDPESAESRAIATNVVPVASLDPTSLLPTGDDAAALDTLDAGAASVICDRVAAALAGSTRPPRAVDARIDRAIAAMRSRLDAAPRLGELAAAAGLSISRFGHLFREIAGIPVRRYQLWLRLIAALSELSTGCSLTEAAHAAGFADSAHMARTFRRMFGIAPSALHRHSRFVQARQ